MSTETKQLWEHKRTLESREVENVLRPFFDQVDAYRYNSASLRIRVIDRKFESKSRAERDAMVEEKLLELPLETQQDIINIVTLAASHFDEGHSLNFGDLVMNMEFENPSPDDI